MEEILTKFVDFEKYCKDCKFKDKSENEEPCNECLGVPARQYSHKPIKFKENKTKE